MRPQRRRIGYAVMAAVIAALLILSSQPLFLWMLVLLLVLPVVLFLLLRHDAQRLSIAASLPGDGQGSAVLTISLTAQCPGGLWAAKYAVLELEVFSAMFGKTEPQRLLLPLQRGTAQYETQLPAELCGEVQVRCTAVRVWDILELISLPAQSFSPLRVTRYPARAPITLTLSRTAAGTSNVESAMQNRRGNDPTQIFDVREYAPGDDVRAIHWKLSGKLDTLYVREASDPSHYDLMLLPDLGLRQADTEVSAAELNAAVAVCIALCEQLLRQAHPFCLAVPTRQGLQLHEVSSERELHRLLSDWMSIQIAEHSGTGLQYFRTDGMERYFTRLVLVSAGKYAPQLGGLQERIGVTLISTAETIDPSYAALGTAGSNVVLPAHAEAGAQYRVLC